MKVKDILKDGAIWMPGGGYEDGTPIVTVILPTFSSAKDGYFERTVQSVLNQSLTNIELIIVDDCSTDETFDLIKYFMKADKRVSCIRHSFNIGLPAISTYEAYLKAKGEYIAFIFDENQWDKDFLNKTIAFMVREDLKASYGEARCITNKEANEFFTIGNVEALNAIRVNNCIPNLGVVLSKEVVETVGWYDPNVLMNRYWDWDLWIRILKKYKFEQTGIFVGYSYEGISKKTPSKYDFNSWCLSEIMSIDRNQLLSVKNFPEYDVAPISSYNTELYLDNLKKELEGYENKHWYKKEEITSFKCNKKLKRIIIIAASIDATISLLFERIIDGNPNYIFNFNLVTNFLESGLVFADAVIIVRDLLGTKKIVKMCEAMDIPRYFFLDDNFIEIAKENKKNKIFQSWSQDLNRKYLKNFKGVFLSTQKLVDYFHEFGLHENLILLEPVIDANHIRKIEKKSLSDPFVMAFMGGGFRSESFLNIVLPAVERISKNRKVVVLCPEYKEFSGEYGNSNMDFIQIPYSRSLDLTLNRYKKYKPDILIHCGKDIKNNVYKTENSLINAVQIGAVLVVSNLEPYKHNDNNIKKYVLSDDTIESWHNYLRYLIENEEERLKIYYNAREYCEKRYSGNIAKNVIINELENINQITYLDMIKRYDEMYKNEVHKLNKYSIEANYETDRPLNSTQLVLSQPICDSIKYDIRCTVDNLSEIGICFACYGIPVGFVIITIWDHKIKLREVVLNLEDYVKDYWTYVEFQPIMSSLKKVFTIEFEFKYEKNSSLMGIFEDASHRTVIYKVCNKLGHRINGMDAIFVDCKE